MKHDRYDEFYMLQTKAKGLERNAKYEEALVVYLDILDNYFPDTDFSFERAVALLEKKNRIEDAQKYCQIAIERIKAGRMRGNIEFFNDHLAKYRTTTSPQKKTNPTNFFKNKGLIIGVSIYLIFSILLSLPNKLHKMAFLTFGAITALLVFEIVKRLNNKISIKWQSVALTIFGVATLIAAMRIPPPEWTSFFSLKPLSEVGIGRVSTSDAEDKKHLDNQITQDDLEILENLYQNNLAMENYTLIIDDDTIQLTVYLKPATSEKTAKDTCFKILKELNNIKEYKSEKDRLGDLYKHYETTIIIYDSNNILAYKGYVNQFTQKIKW